MVWTNINQVKAALRELGSYTPEEPSCWNTSTYLFLTFFFAACDRDRPMGGALGMLPGAGVFGIEATSEGAILGRARIGALKVEDAFKSIVDAVLGGGG